MTTIVRRGHRLALVAVASASWACQGEPPPSVTSQAPVVTIVGSLDSPERLEVPPGATVVVENFDPLTHTVTSAAADGTYAPGGVNGVQFDTGPIAASAAFAIPADAPPGTVVPYFCSIHRETTQERGVIAVVEGTPGAAAPR
jgi:plastocyanin